MCFFKIILYIFITLYAHDLWNSIYAHIVRLISFALGVRIGPSQQNPGETGRTSTLWKSTLAMNWTYSLKMMRKYQQRVFHVFNILFILC